jgi:hypothetical protein
MRLTLSHIIDFPSSWTIATAAIPQCGPETGVECIVAASGTEGILVIEAQRAAIAWYDMTGSILIQRMSCSSRPRMASFCRFPTIGTPGASATVAIVAWVGDGDLQIFQFGNHHDVKFPFAITGLHIPDVGLIIEAQHGKTYSLKIS